ncbi:hypothetical protein [Streptomyces sp. NPDC050504]|uniref:hypothetical protein n=1 Tax=Streptomyces sp. NPDC050504 TaxID=3365618 RepID=UPI0037AEB71E
MRRITLALAAAALALTAAVGCSAIEKAVDCVQTADAISNSVDNLQRAAKNAALEPSTADKELDEIKNELDRLGDRTDDADLEKAVDDLKNGVASVRDAVEKGDRTPDLSPITDATKEIGKICTP